MIRKMLPLAAAGLLTIAGCVSDDDYKKAQDEKDKAYFLAGLFAVGAITTLVVGVALGSKARYAAK